MYNSLKCVHLNYCHISSEFKKHGNEVLYDIHCMFPAVCNWHIHKGVETMYSLMRMCVTIIIILGYTI